ncbi:MAG: hypothetical protein IKO84_04865 [Butyrivibrio sp.]|nr:hypothetical protein [Butyrivibrio sp.]
MGNKIISGNADHSAVSPLLLNNELFTQKQNNILNRESMLKLDTSAIEDMGNNLAGTESMNLLINNWRNVAGSGDTFRNFACNDADLMFTKTQKSINEVDALNAGSIGGIKTPPSGKAALMSPSELIPVLLPLFYSPDPEPEKLPTDPFDEYGQYGGNQMDLGAGVNWCGVVKEEDYDVYRFVMNKEPYKNYTRSDVQNLLKFITTIGCTFTAMANAIFAAYKGRPEEFEKVFGFPMVGKDGDLNYRMLIVDVFLETSYAVDLSEVNSLKAFKAIYADPKNIDAFNKNYNKNCKTIEDVQYECNIIMENAFKTGNTIIPIGYYVSTSSEEFENRFATYCKKKGIDSYTYKAAAVLNKSEIERQLKEDKTVVISLKYFKLQNEQGQITWEQEVPKSDAEKVKDAAHAMVVTGIAPDGRLIVSSWGKKYYIDINDQVPDMMVSFVSYIDVRPSPNTISPQESKLYDDIGIYGGRAPGSLKENYTQAEIMNIMKRYPGYANCTDEDFTKATDRFRRLGSIYVPMANSFFESYQGRPKEFEEKFNIPMVNGKGDLNVDLLAFMIFLETDRKVYFDEPDGLDCCADYIKDYYLKNPDSYKITHNNKVLLNPDNTPADGMAEELEVTSRSNAQSYKEIVGEHGETEMKLPENFDAMSNHSFANRFSHYCKEHGFNMTLKTLEKDGMDSCPSYQNVMTELEKNNHLVCRIRNDRLLLNDRGEAEYGFYEQRSKMMNIIGVTTIDNGNERFEAYIVSNSGKQYYLKTDSVEEIYSIEYNA